MKYTTVDVTKLIIRVAAIGFIIASMLTERSNSFLAVGLALISVVNVIDWKTGKRGYNPCRKNRTSED